MISAVHIILVVISLILLTNQCHCVTTNECSHQTLVLVQAIFRHGNRTRDSSEGFATNLYNKETDWLPEGHGQLTAAGRTTEYILGQFLRSRYDGFLNRTYYYKDISVLSSNKYRTRESAQLVCAGLYSPPVDYNRWGEGQLLGTYWQPIPVENMPKEDIWLETHTKCQPYDKEYEEVQKSGYASVNEEYRTQYEQLAKYTGEKVETVTTVSKIINTIRVDKENNKTLPEWVKPELMDSLEPLQLMAYKARTESDFMKKVKAGPLMHLLSVNLNNKTRDSLNPNNKMILYSAHDTTIVHILHTLDTTKLWLPNYGACILLELHKIQGQYYVQIFYLPSGRDKNPEPVFLKVLPNESLIPLDVLNQRLDKYKTTEEEWYKLCQKEHCSSEH